MSGELLIDVASNNYSHTKCRGGLCVYLVSASTNLLAPAVRWCLKNVDNPEACKNQSVKITPYNCDTGQKLQSKRNLDLAFVFPMCNECLFMIQYVSPTKLIDLVIQVYTNKQMLVRSQTVFIHFKICIRYAENGNYEAFVATFN